MREVSLSLAWERLSRPLLRSILVALVGGVVAAGIGFGVVWTHPKTYQSQALLLLDEPLAVASSQDAGVILKLSDLRAKYVALAVTSPVVDGAAALSHLPAATISADAQVSADPNELLIDVGAHASSPSTSRAVAQALGRSLVFFVRDEQGGLGVAPANQVQLRLVQAALHGVKIAPTTRRIAATSAVAGVVMLFVVYTVSQLIWTRRAGY